MLVIVFVNFVGFLHHALWSLLHPVPVPTTPSTDFNEMTDSILRSIFRCILRLRIGLQIIFITLAVIAFGVACWELSFDGAWLDWLQGWQLYMVGDQPSVEWACLTNLSMGSYTKVLTG